VNEPTHVAVVCFTVAVVAVPVHVADDDHVSI
jgi:hypothetical protein